MTKPVVGALNWGPTLNDHLDTLVSKGDLLLNVKDEDYGAIGDGVADDSPAIQAAIDAAFITGGLVYIPAGKYKIVTPLYLDLREASGGPTGGPASNNRRVQFAGAGKGNTALRAATDSTTILRIQGDNPLTSASHAYTAIRDLAFVGQTPTARTADGLKLQDLAYLTVADCSFHDLNVGLNLDGCLASSFRDLIFNESVKGVVATAAASGPHSNLWSGCEFRALTSMAYDGFTSLSGATFNNCRFEGCGTMASGLPIIRQNTGGTAGEHGMTLVGCYIENNRGTADIELNETGSQRVGLTIIGTCFNRVSSTDFVTNNIKTTGDVDINLLGSTFTSYNTYVPDAGRTYLNLSSSARLRDLGNRFEDAVEAPMLDRSLPFAGHVAGSAGASVTGTLPRGWTVSQVSAGLFRVTHNLGHTNYAVNATTCGVNNRTVERYTRNSNSFDVKTVNTADAAADEDFTFQVVLLRG